MPGSSLWAANGLTKALPSNLLIRLAAADLKIPNADLGSRRLIVKFLAQRIHDEMAWQKPAV